MTARFQSLAPAVRLADQVADALAAEVRSGRLSEGDRLPTESALAEQFGVSRTVVREAVKSLVAKGLLTTGPKVGTKVQPAEQWNWFDPDVVAWQSQAGLTREFLRDLQELRRVVEPAAVRIAAERATPDDIADAVLYLASDSARHITMHDLRIDGGATLGG